MILHLEIGVRAYTLSELKQEKSEGAAALCKDMQMAGAAAWVEACAPHGGEVLYSRRFVHYRDDLRYEMARAVSELTRELINRG